MNLVSTKQRRAVALAVGASSVLLALFVNEPSGLLVAVAVICICIGWEAGLVAVAAAGLLSSVILLPQESGATSGAVRLAVFVVAALALWFVIKIFRTMSFYSRVYRDAGPSIADIPGLGWSAS
ncbi:MAG: PAS domain-containing sensor histidine kinase, partial [Mesorhizobium sp.]